MGRRKEIGAIVMVMIDGKVAEKKDGKLTGRMIELKKNMVGKVASARTVGMGTQKIRAYTIQLSNGVVELRANHVTFPEGGDVRIPHSALLMADPDYQMKDEDLEATEEVEY